MTPDQIGRMLADLERRVARVENSPRLSHAAIDGTAVEVRDGSGGLRALLGLQGDGTTAVNIVNGPPPPTPSAPIVASVLGGITVSWSGGFVDGTVPPLDWQRVEVHASTTDGFVPALETLKSTFETPQGGTVVVPCEEPVYVRLIARNTSGTASEPTGQAGPLGPAPVVATDILDGIVTELKLANDAVTEAKIAADAVGSVALQESAVLAENLADAAVEVGKIADNAVTGPAIASEAVTAGKLAANSVVAGNIESGAVTADKVAAGAITTDKLTVVGGANVLNDPSFEGVYAASVAARFSQWTVQDLTFGNGSPASMKITTDGTAQWRAVELALLPTTAGDELYIAADYYASAGWAGSELNMHVRWETEGGTTLATDKANSRATSPVKGAWTRLAGTYTAPATAVRARVRIEAGLVTAGDTWFDNAVCRPVVSGVQIQDGAISTPKIAAGAVQTAQLDAGAVNADKIASGAVTTGKLDALAVTGDKIAANAITAGKILAGAVDATALAADAITGKTITGGTITGSLIQTAESGERITINEAGQNKVLVYDATSAIGELSDQGLLLKGTNGSIIWLDPDNIYPNLIFTNAGRTNHAVVNVVETTAGSADLGLNSGTFTGSGYTDMKWRTFFGADFAVMERVRDSAPTSPIGGRLNLRADYGSVGYTNSVDTSQNTMLSMYASLAQLSKGRLEVYAPSSTSSAFYVGADTAHTGPLLRLYRDSDKLTVDKDGNTSIAGTITAGNIASGRIIISAGGGSPVSGTVNGLNLQGVNIRVVATPVTGAPGTAVLGVGVNNQSSTGFTVWITRSGTTTATAVDWVAYCL